MSVSDGFDHAEGAVDEGWGEDVRPPSEHAEEVPSLEVV